MKLVGRVMAACAAALLLAVPGAAQDSGEIVVTGLPDRAVSQWVRAETANFAVHSRDEAEARQVATRLERFDQLLRIVTQVTPPPATYPLPVYLVFGSSQIERLRRDRLPPYFFATGYYSAAPTGVLLAADMRWDRLSAREPAYHDVWLFTEYCRHFLIANARGAYLPAWYIDGMSLYLSGTHFTGDAVEFGQFNPAMAALLADEQWEPIGQIVSGALDHGQLYSAESTLLVHYIFADPERVRAFARFVAAVRGGADAVPAFEAAFGMRMKVLQNRLWRYRSDARFIHATMRAIPDPDVAIIRLPQSADALLLDQAAMRIGIPEPDRQRAVLRRAEAAVARRSDVFAQRVLAQAQILYGGAPPAADAALDALLEITPADPELLYLKGLRHLMIGRADAARRAAEFDAARRWFVRAHHADPDYYPALYAWAESLSNEPRFLSENTLNVLTQAALLAPHASQIRVTTALALMADGRFDTVARLLTPIMVTPRDPASEQIPALLAQARERRRPDMAQVIASFRYTADWKDLNCC